MKFALITYLSQRNHNLESALVPYHAIHDLPARSVLVLAPHPDDEVFGCGGALIRHVQAGCPVAVIVLTDGAYGSVGIAKNQVIETREAESRAAATMLGYPQPEFWRIADRGLDYGEVLIDRVLDAIQVANADLVYAPALTEMHPDHRALAMIAVEAVRRLGSDVRLAMYEVGVPLSPNTLMDISDVSALKLAAMRCFASQLLIQSYDDHIVALNRFRTYTLPANVTMAEAFGLHKGVDLSPSVLPLFESEYVRQSRLGLSMFGARDTPLLSVVLLSMGNAGLGEVLDALSLQTYQNIEVVVVNAQAGKHPSLGSQCGRFRMRLIGGDEGTPSVSAAANAGLRAAIGAYFTFLDDACNMDPEHYSSLMAVAKSHAPQSVVAYSGVTIPTSRGDNVENQMRIQTEVSPRELLLCDFLSFNAPLVPRSLIESGITLDEELDFQAFRDLWIRLADIVPFVYSGRITSSYLAPKQTATREYEEDQQNIFQSNVKILEKWAPKMDAKKLFELSLIFQKREKKFQKQLLQLGYADITQDRLQNTVEDLQIKRDLYGRKVSELEQTVDHLEKSLVTAREEILSLRISTSWRLTGPLRFVFKQLLRIKNFWKPHL